MHLELAIAPVVSGLASSDALTASSVLDCCCAVVVVVVVVAAAVDISADPAANISDTPPAG